jgi:hypothetical protein
MKPRLLLLVTNLALLAASVGPWVGRIRPGSWSDGHSAF